jgi:hypothetical protein
MAELRYGGEKPARRDENREAVEGLAGRVAVLPL